MSFINIYCFILTGMLVCLLIDIIFENEVRKEIHIVLRTFISQLCWVSSQLGLDLHLMWFSIDSLKDNSEPKTNHSSVWCLADVDGHKICTFKNLCYVPLERQFIFILTGDSVLSGINTKSELKSLELSSLSNHNQFTMNTVMVSPSHNILKRKLIGGRSAYILWRFKRDNIMHVIHDDLLPLYATYSNICSGDIERCISKYQLAFLDSGDNSGPLIEWYKLFSNSEPLLLQKQNHDTIMCFDEIGTGLVRSSTWFQYGYGVPQGPLNNTQLTGNTIRQFSNFIVRKFRLVVPTQNIELTNATAVIFSRRINRKILNEYFLVKVINDSYYSMHPECQELNMNLMDLSVNSTRSILQSLLKSDVVVGMHGAIMILSIFLPPGSVVIELFPFGIVPEYVSPLKALSLVHGMHFLYKSWENTEESNSRTHPEALPIFGGIAHLSEEEQHEVRSLIPIPAMECCHNPAYLYRMFQDTIVAPSFKSTFESALRRHKHSKHTWQPDKFVISQWWYPASISNATCELTPATLKINWNPSINIEGIKSWYELTIVGNNLHLEFVSVTAELKIERPVASLVTVLNEKVDVWIKCVADGEESVDTHVQCSAASA